jgi:hypothetical protein
MKFSAILAATILVAAAPLAMASKPIQDAANAKKDGTTYTCKTCHTTMPPTKAGLTDTGKKFVKK